MKRGKKLYKKQYLVACYDKQDEINCLQKTYLRLKTDLGECDLKASRHSMKIIGKNIEILFRSRNQLFGYELLFYGVAKTTKFDRLANDSERNEWEMQRMRTKSVYGANDCDGVMRMYVR